MLNKGGIIKIADNLLANLRNEVRLPSSISKCLRREPPLLVKNLDDNPSYWLVPFLSEDRLVGFVRISLSGGLMAYGRFGQGKQLSDFPPISQISSKNAEKEMHKAFSKAFEEISPPQLVHDGPVGRIAWLSRGKSRDGEKMLLFWTFGTFYSRPEGKESKHGLL